MCLLCIVLLQEEHNAASTGFGNLIFI